jgi:hypothetical protein
MADGASQTFTVEHWAVGFLDLLGQRAALRKMDFLPADNDETKKAELIAAVTGSVGVIEKFYRLYQVFGDGGVRSEDDPIPGVPSGKQELAREWLSTDLRHARFSDGLMVYSSLVASPQHSPVAAVFRLICASGSLMLTSLAWGHPIRVGLDVGTGVEVERGQLHGPAVVKAYELESRAAEYPRVIVGDTLADYLQAQAAQTGDERTQFNARQADLARAMLSQDADGQRIVDYLGKAFRSQVAREIDPKIVHDAQEFAAKSLDRFKREPASTSVAVKRERDDGLAARYQRLVDYFDRKAHVWIDP